MEDSGEGRWTVNAAIDEAVPAEVLTAALFARFRSRKEHTFAEKILSAMRDGFGGHKEPQQHRTRFGRMRPISSSQRPTVVTDVQHPMQKKPDPCLLRHFRRHRRPGAPAGRSRASITSRRATCLPDRFCVVGVARKGMPNDELRDSLMKGLREFATRPVDDAIAQRLLACVDLHRRRSEGAGLVRQPCSKQLDRLEANADNRRQPPVLSGDAAQTRSRRSAGNSAAPACCAKRTAHGGGW